MKRISGIIMMVMLLALAVAPWAGAAEKGKPKKAAKVNRGPYTDPTTGMQFVWVPGGCYMMGDTFGNGDKDERPVHEVCVDGFYMGKYEVTQGQWQKIMGSNPSYFASCGSDCPVEKVSWDDVQGYIGKLNGETGKRYRLPTEAEWEYAARSGGKKEKWAGTSGEAELGEYAWYGKNSDGKTHVVGQKKPNGLGLYDMTGNVYEWVSGWMDYYDEDWFKVGARKNPQGAESGSHRVSRGGSCDYLAGRTRASYRYTNSPGGSCYDLGFRLVLPPVQ